MNLWHMQLHPTGATAWTVENTRHIVATGYYNQQNEMYQKLKRNVHFLSGG